MHGTLAHYINQCIIADFSSRHQTLHHCIKQYQDITFIVKCVSKLDNTTAVIDHLLEQLQTNKVNVEEKQMEEDNITDEKIVTSDQKKTKVNFSHMLKLKLEREKRIRREKRIKLQY